MKTLLRVGASLFFVMLVSGCSSIGSVIGFTTGSSEPEPSRECQWNPSGCIYKGRYEAGERDYAEQEARRLNRAAVERLRRNSIL